VNALANDKVGEYVNDNFVTTFLKIGTFTIANGNKQGGNVASYFCQPDGSVLHAIAGPVNANDFLKEARWVVETRKLAVFESRGDAHRFKTVFGRAHNDRLNADYGMGNWRESRTKMVRRPTPGMSNMPSSVGDAFPDPNDAMAMARINALVVHQAANRGLDNRGKVHLLLSNYPMVKIEQVYKYVFEKILNEQVSTLPVVQN